MVNYDLNMEQSTHLAQSGKISAEEYRTILSGYDKHQLIDYLVNENTEDSFLDSSDTDSYDDEDDNSDIYDD